MYSDFSLINYVLIGLVEYLVWEKYCINRNAVRYAILLQKQAQSLSRDIETKVLNDLAEVMHAQVEILVERPQLIKVLIR